MINFILLIEEFGVEVISAHFYLIEEHSETFICLMILELAYGCLVLGAIMVSPS
jgi:hypothetical protein